MSHVEHSDNTCCTLTAGCGAISQLVYPKDKDLGGFSVRRLFPNQKIKRVGPWVFFDHMGPANFLAGQGVNVRPHPHINIATVTYLFDGEILHRDSIGSEQVIRPGDLNLMVTGSGMVHSERESDCVKNVPHSVHGLQLWLALPENDEETTPAFYHYSANELPQVTQDGAIVRVMMGDAFGVKSPVKTFSTTLYIEASIAAGKALLLPNAEQRGLYIIQGELSIGDMHVKAHTMIIFNQEDNIVIHAINDAKIALIGGDDIGHRYIDWNFVSSRKERIQQAIQQWQDQKFPLIAGDAEEFIPYPTKKP